MLRKTVLGAAAALTLGLAAMAPTAASAGGGFHLHVGGFGGGYWGPGYGGGYWGPSCYIKKVKVWSHAHHHFHWKKKKVCY